MNTPLVSVEELSAHPGWRLFDCRHELTAPELGGRQYAEGHLPGALHAHLDRDLSGSKTGTNGRHPLPQRESLAAWLGKQGVTADNVVVAYDASGGPYAARLWWLLRWLGHSRVTVLDGGVDAWLRGGHLLTRDVPAPRATTYAPGPSSMPTVDVDHVVSHLHRTDTVILDARGRGRYAGQGEALDPVGGHIPGARNRPYLDNLEADGRFKSSGVLRDELTRMLGRPSAAHVISQCGSGVTACHNLLAMEVAGLGTATLYPGSWSEWCSDPTRPVTTGENP